MYLITIGINFEGNHRSMPYFLDHSDGFILALNFVKYIFLMDFTPNKCTSTFSKEFSGLTIISTLKGLHKVAKLTSSLTVANLTEHLAAITTGLLTATEW